MYTEFIPNIELIIVFLLGLSFGSFATLVSYRLPRGEDIVFTPSRCPSCSRRLGFFDLFPVISWAFNKGKCAHCDVKVSARYPLIELSMGLAFVLVYDRFGISPAGGVLLLLTVCLVIIIVTDLEHTIIPDKIQVVMVVLGIIYRLLPDSYSPIQIIVGPAVAVSFGLVLRYIFTKWKEVEALGLGDVKFLITIGLFLDQELFISFLFLSGILGIITSLIWRKKDQDRHFPFGPALAITLYFCVVMPEMQELVRQYIFSMVL